MCLGVISSSFVLWGVLRPEGAHWGFHALAYYPASVQIATFLFVFLLLLLSAAGFLRLPRLPPRLCRLSPWLEIASGLVAFLIFYSFPIQGFAYGDSKSMLEWYGDNYRFDSKWILRVFELNTFSGQ